MPFGLCNASATFQKNDSASATEIVNREGSMDMAYIDDVVIATETSGDHVERLRDVFQCLSEAGFKTRDSKCDFVKSEIKYLGRIVSTEGIKHYPKAAAKLQDWDIPRNKSETQSFLGFANYYGALCPGTPNLLVVQRPGHQGIAKGLARIQERHIWSGICKCIGQYVSRCLTCQQGRDEPGDVPFHLKNIRSG